MQEERKCCKTSTEIFAYSVLVFIIIGSVTVGGVFTSSHALAVSTNLTLAQFPRILDWCTIVLPHVKECITVRVTMYYPWDTEEIQITSKNSSVKTSRVNECETRITSSTAAYYMLQFEIKYKYPDTLFVGYKRPRNLTIMTDAYCRTNFQ